MLDALAFKFILPLSSSPSLSSSSSAASLIPSPSESASPDHQITVLNHWNISLKNTVWVSVDKTFDFNLRHLLQRLNLNQTNSVTPECSSWTNNKKKQEQQWWQSHSAENVGKYLCSRDDGTWSCRTDNSVSTGSYCSQADPQLQAGPEQADQPSCVTTTRNDIYMFSCPGWVPPVCSRQWSYLGCQTSDSASSSKFHHLA